MKTLVVVTAALFAMGVGLASAQPLTTHLMMAHEGHNSKNAAGAAKTYCTLSDVVMGSGQLEVGTGAEAGKAFPYPSRLATTLDGVNTIEAIHVSNTYKRAGLVLWTTPAGGQVSRAQFYTITSSAASPAASLTLAFGTLSGAALENTNIGYSLVPGIYREGRWGYWNTTCVRAGDVAPPSPYGHTREEFWVPIGRPGKAVVDLWFFVLMGYRNQADVSTYADLQCKTAIWGPPPPTQNTLTIGSIPSKMPTLRYITQSKGTGAEQKWNRAVHPLLCTPRMASTTSNDNEPFIGLYVVSEK